MRITGGELCGRRLPAPRPGVRPTQDRVREAIFNSLAPLMPGSRVLDLFAGSGTLGMEAWSRGAAQVTWVESDMATARALEQVVRQFCSSSPDRPTRIVRADACRFLAANTVCPDIVFADPPYEHAHERGKLEHLAQLMQSNSVYADSLLVFETAKKGNLLVPPVFECLRDRSYGQTRVLLLKPIPDINRVAAKGHPDAQERRDSTV